MMVSPSAIKPPITRAAEARRSVVFITAPWQSRRALNDRRIVPDFDGGTQAV